MRSAKPRRSQLGAAGSSARAPCPKTSWERRVDRVVFTGQNSSSRSRIRQRTGGIPRRELAWLQQITIAGPYVVLLRAFAGQSHRDRAPAMIRVRLRIVAQRIKMGQIITDRSKGLFFVSPVAREIGFSAGSLRHALENDGRDRLELGLPRADHVDRYSRRLR
jgi:hypothetical protein